MIKVWLEPKNVSPHTACDNPRFLPSTFELWLSGYRYSLVNSLALALAYGAAAIPHLTANNINSYTMQYSTVA